MKPQTGILSSAHSDSKQYVQFYVESECAVDSHPGLRVKVPDIQQYTHSTVLRLLLAQARLLSWHWLSRVSRARERVTEYIDDGDLP